MGNNIKIVIVLIASILLLAISIFVNFKYYNKLQDYQGQVKELSLSKDSLINVKITENKIDAVYHQELSDSLLHLSRLYDVSIEINHKKYQNEIKQIVTYTPMRRNAVLDSIFRANGIK